MQVHKVVGGSNTTECNISVAIDGMRILVSSGDFRNQEVTLKIQPLTITVQADTQYPKDIKLYLLKDGTLLLEETLLDGKHAYNTGLPAAICLLWGTVPANTIDLLQADLHVIQVVNASA